MAGRTGPGRLHRGMPTVQAVHLRSAHHAAKQTTFLTFHQRTGGNATPLAIFASPPYGAAGYTGYPCCAGG